MQACVSALCSAYSIVGVHHTFPGDAMDAMALSATRMLLASSSMDTFHIVRGANA